MEAKRTTHFSAVIGNQAGNRLTRPALRRRFPFWVVLFLATGSAFLSSATAATSQADNPVKISILVYNFVSVPDATLAAAEREANRILGLAGAQVDWISCPVQTESPSADASDPCRRGWTPQTPGLRIIAGSNKFQTPEYGNTALPVLITVYYEKIQNRAHRDNSAAELPTLLGCVLAHELGHLLLGNPGHSSSGIMQPQWSATQIRQAQTGHLLFTREQATLIHAQAPHEE
jgi:hypothetical protein